jgi:hypothetical protein
MLRQYAHSGMLKGRKYSISQRRLSKRSFHSGVSEQIDGTPKLYLRVSLSTNACCLALIDYGNRPSLYRVGDRRGLSIIQRINGGAYHEPFEVLFLSIRESDRRHQF